MNYRFVFCHGWGFDHKFLKPIIDRYFSKASCYCLDLGYFGEENLNLSGQGNIIGIGHSYGFKKLISLNINFKALIGIQAFVDFLGSSLQLQRKRELELRIVKNHFQVDPINTLVSFYKKCGLVNYGFFDRLDRAKLTQDLELLTLKSKLPHGIPVLILGATNDMVVPPEIIYDNFKQNAKIVMHNKGHHRLGLNEHYFVYKQIMSFLDGIAKNICTE